MYMVRNYVLVLRPIVNLLRRQQLCITTLRLLPVTLWSYLLMVLQQTSRAELDMLWCNVLTSLLTSLVATRGTGKG